MHVTWAVGAVVAAAAAVCYGVVAACTRRVERAVMEAMGAVPI